MKRILVWKDLAIRSYSIQVPKSVPVITTPVYLQGKLEKLQKKREREELEAKIRRRRSGNKDVKIIAARDPNLDYYLGQTFAKYSIIPLASRGWRKPKSAGDFFTIKKFAENPSLPMRPEETENGTEEEGTSGFSQMGLHERVIEGLENIGIRYPTPIQSLAIPKMINHEHVLLSAETGSGKTAAYLAPILHHLVTKKESFISRLPPNTPQALILVPGRELAEQIAEVASKMCCFCGMNSRTLIGGKGTKRIISHPNAKSRDPEVDILVTTFGVIRKLVDTRVYDVSHVQHVVIDEADTMLDDSFNDDLCRFLKNFAFHEGNFESENFIDGTQLILAGATLPRNIEKLLDDCFNTEYLVKISTSHLHRIMPHVSQKFMRMKFDDKAEQLLKLVKADANRKSPVMIFANKSSCTDWISLFLEENNVPNIHLHGDVPNKARFGRFESFQKGEVDVLCCTDLGSRGLDTVRLQHIINFDCPVHMSDYIHRAGRLGRVNSQGTGRVTTFVTKPYEAELVQRIELAVRTVKALRGVNANIKKTLIMKSLGKEGISEELVEELM